MPSMSYCRWTNLLADLQDCYDHKDKRLKAYFCRDCQGWHLTSIEEAP